MTSMTLPKRLHPYGAQPRYPCGRCGRHQTADRMVWSRWTRARYCTDLKSCEKRARRRA